MIDIANLTITDTKQSSTKIKQKGNLVYEYNPFKVLRLNEDGDLKNEITDLDTDLLTFSLQHPVDIEVLQSYDGSVNLILNDGINLPRLINSRFSYRGMGTYEIVDRAGNNDTNIYDKKYFKSQTSLYKISNTIVDLLFLGLTSGGNLKVGSYTFYFKLADEDGNETDFIAESSKVVCYKGNVNDPFSIDAGMEDENSFKRVHFLMSNIDSAYTKVIVYYTRSSASQEAIAYTNAYRIGLEFEVYNGKADIDITGFEVTQKSTIRDINALYQVVDSAVTQVQCLNMLFLANVSKPKINYKELADLSLRIYPEAFLEGNWNSIGSNYLGSNKEYFDASNIYYKLGYWHDEIYRFGVVYILEDYSLSPVFNIRGYRGGAEQFTGGNNWDIYTEGKRNYIPIDTVTNKIGANDNSKGVYQIPKDLNPLAKGPIGIKFVMHSGLKDELENLKIKGYFFVRLKRIKTTFAQAITIGLDKSSGLPLLPGGTQLVGNNTINTYVGESFITKSENKVIQFLDKTITTNKETERSRELSHNFTPRKLLISENNVYKGGAALCPEYEVNQAYFNQFFTVSDFKVIPRDTVNFTWSGNYCTTSLGDIQDNMEQSCTISAVQDGVKVVKGKERVFRGKAGEAEDATKFEYYGFENKDTKAYNIARGMFGPYLGLESTLPIESKVIDIKVPGYDRNAIDEYYEIRYNDASPFFAITDRYKIENTNTIIAYRGDCYICNFTHRMLRNFLDSDAPNNDTIIKPDTWEENYEVGNKDSAEKRAKINRGDVNAVRLGHWVTVRVCSNINLSMRSTNPYYPSEQGLTGRLRGFYPLYSMSTDGSAKIPESDMANAGFSVTTSEKYYKDLPYSPYIKDEFSTRILYSDIAINDLYKNSYRIFRNDNYQDYPKTYGRITKLVEWLGYLICIFEHGVGVIPVNERAVAASSDGGDAYINTSKVLPLNPKIINGDIGTLWSESVVQTPYGVYGIDTVAKKLWKIDYTAKTGFLLTTISDFKCLKFLNDNITLTEHETTPLIGVRNVKSHYNAFKHDVMFTFYDDVNSVEEKVWNICYNEILGKFITFYSWVPSHSANIDNIFFTFDRNTSKYISKLYADTSLISLKGGNELQDDVTSYLLLSNYNNSFSDSLNTEWTISYVVNDPHNLFTVEKDGIEYYIKAVDFNKLEEASIYTIPITATFKAKPTVLSDLLKGVPEYKIHTRLMVSKGIYKPLTTHFWKHGLAGLMSTDTEILPCNWYGKLHPFEFEVIVADNPDTHKIFTNLQIIANKAEPESLHFEITGDVYNFADDKENMFWRQEATKHIYQYNGGDILYNSKYLDILPKQRSIENDTGDKYYDKSTIFPLHCSRVDTINEIEDMYQVMTGNGIDYQRLSGSEIIHNTHMNEYHVATHIKALPIKKCGRRVGNMDYTENKWYLQIPSIIYRQANESEWKYPPIDLNNTPLPESLTLTTLNVPKLLSGKASTSNAKWSNIKETRIRDRYLKVKIRYSGKDLAVISYLKTLYTISYA